MSPFLHAQFCERDWLIPCIFCSLQGDNDEFLGLYSQCFNYTWEQKRYGQMGAKVTLLLRVYSCKLP